MTHVLRRSLIIYAIDDGYFPYKAKSGRCYTLLAMVKYIYELQNSRLLPLDVIIDKILVDHDYVELKISRLYREINKREEDNFQQLMLLDGITYAGFNVVNPIELYQQLGIPIIVFFYKDLDLGKIITSLQKHFPDYSYRFNIIKTIYSGSVRLLTKLGEIRVYSQGIDNLRILRSTIESMQLYSRTPEPLRVAHIIASTLSRSLYMLNHSILCPKIPHDICLWCGGWDLNPRRPTPSGPEPDPFDQARAPPHQFK